MARRNTIKLLLINGSDNEAERLISLFRKAGRVARVQRATGLDDLLSALERPADLLIADDTVSSLAPEQVLDQLAKLEDAPPALVLRTTDDPQRLFAAGARDVIPPTDDQRLVCAALRELDYAALRQQLRRTEAQLVEAEHRNALLLGQSAEAIAYVTDGMVTGASPLFAQRFGYADGDAIDLVPIIDLVAEESHDLVKAALKTQDGAEVPFTGVTEGEPFQGVMRLTAASYDGEPCTQVTVTERGATGSGETASERDDESGLFSTSWLRNHLTGAGGTLMVVSIDNFVQLRRQLGYGLSRRLAAHLGEFLGALPALAGAPLARAADDAAAAVVGATGEAAVALAQQVCGAVSDHIVELDGQSIQCTVSIGLVGAAGGSADELLDRAFGSCERLREASSNGIGNGVRQWQPSQLERAQQRSGASPEAALQEALDEDRFALLFQPIISLRGSRGDHYEALLRLHGETDELEQPDNLLNALSADAANAKLDRWVLIEATKQLAANRAQGNETHLVINLTASALLDDALVSWIGVAMKAAGLPTDALVFQLREADVITYLKPARQFADAMRQLGCRVSISGFGRALDPLKTLKTVPADLVQLDGSFTRELQNSGQVAPLKELVSAITAQEVKVIIPYVENAAVLATLWQVGADFIQGHYLQPPARQMNYEFADIA